METRTGCRRSRRNGIVTSYTYDALGRVLSVSACVAKENNANVTVKKFVRFERGEGMEKKNEDFAAEVAKQMNV